MSELPFELCNSHVSPDVITVSDAEMDAGVRLAAERMKVVVEMSAGAALMAALKVRETHPGLKRVGVVLCGGNIDICDHFSSDVKDD